MHKLIKLLRRLEPWQIVAVGVASWAALMALVVFGLGPLAFLLMAPAGEAAASVASLIVSIGGVVLIGLHLPKPFVLAFYARRIDDEMQRMALAYVEARRNG